jgi:nitrogen fixation protein FixH
MSKQFTGKHMLIIMLTFFGIIFVVNGIMIYFSQSSWTGLETKDAYRKGVKYNQQLSASRAQNDRGWTMNITHDEKPDGSLSFVVEPKDKQKEALSRLDIEIELKRPTHEGIDRKFKLEESGLGVYTGATETLPKGKWYVVVTAAQKNEILYRSKNELYLR